MSSNEVFKFSIYKTLFFEYKIQEEKTNNVEQYVFEVIKNMDLFDDFLFNNKKSKFRENIENTMININNDSFIQKNKLATYQKEIQKYELMKHLQVFNVDVLIYLLAIQTNDTNAQFVIHPVKKNTYTYSRVIPTYFDHKIIDTVRHHLLEKNEFYFGRQLYLISAFPDYYENYYNLSPSTRIQRTVMVSYLSKIYFPIIKEKYHQNKYSLNQFNGYKNLLSNEISVETIFQTKLLIIFHALTNHAFGTNQMTNTLLNIVDKYFIDSNFSPFNSEDYYTKPSFSLLSVPNGIIDFIFKLLDLLLQSFIFRNMFAFRKKNKKFAILLEIIIIVSIIDYSIYVTTGDSKGLHFVNNIKKKIRAITTTPGPTYHGGRGRGRGRGGREEEEESDRTRHQDKITKIPGTHFKTKTNKRTTRTSKRTTRISKRTTNK